MSDKLVLIGEIMELKMKTTEQIIEETANHYNSNNRSLLFDSLGKPV